jgi:hypothetical protein
MMFFLHLFHIARLPACTPARLPACPPARLPACPPDIAYKFSRISSDTWFTN